MINKSLLENEIYTIPHEGKTIAYAPLTRLFSIHDGTISRGELDKSWLESASSPFEVPDFILEKGFAQERKKLRLRMNVTSKCNLSCEYCSVSARNGQWVHMDRDLAFSAVEKFIDLAEKQGMKEVELAFSWWEPTLQWELIGEVIEYADTRLQSTEIALVTKLLTNGVLSESLARQLVPLFNGVQVSWDGFMDDHPRYGDQQKKIAKKVWENIRLFVQEGASTNIAIVVSEHNYLRLWEIIDQLHGTFWIEAIFLSLRDSLWKASDSKSWIDYAKLRQSYMETWKRYREKDIDLPLTGTDIHSVSMYPCGISAPNYSISPTGEISSCTLTFNDQNEHSKSYDIGKVEPGSLILDAWKITSFQKTDVQSLRKCADCFAKWHCRGWCMYANKGEWLWSIDPDRCDMVRNIVADKILWLAGADIT